MSEEEFVNRFRNFGLSEKKTAEIVKNKKVSQSLYEIIGETKELSLDDKKTSLLHHLATESKGIEIPKREIVTEAITDGRLKTNLQVTEATKYVKGNPNSANDKEMSEVSGIGKEISPEQVKSEISKYMASHRDEIEAKRYSGVPSLLGEVKKIPSLKWAAPNLFKPIIDELVLKMLGPKDERDIIKKEKKKGKKQSASASKKSSDKERSMFSEGFLGDLHKPDETPQMYPELLKEQLAITKGKVFTRFPPEPNGYLHIGHSKAIMVNFGYASYHDGNCYLRFDDTNPEAEEEVYFKSIESIIDWLGYKPWKITYSSDYFDQLYELAEKLISNDRGYVCHCTAEQVKEQRGLKSDGTLGGERYACSHRSRLVQDNLTEFRKMKEGHYKVGEATLRMKQDLSSPSPQMWDLVAYRVLNTPHHRTGDKWKIYPTYDFTHCLVDSMEHISHSLCTTEFRLSRESYEWLCDVLHVYRPAQREYGRLNITGTILSKRKIAKLVNEGIVRGWDDPRLYTLEAVRRRGVPPGAILSFINTLGVTTSTTNIQAVRFESAVRAYLDSTTPRLMMLLDPIEVEIEGLPEHYEESIEIPYKPGANEKFGLRKLAFTKRIYIDRSDYRDDVSSEYFRLAPGQPVGLIKVPHNISVKSVEKDSNGMVLKINAIYEKDSESKPKTYIQWIPKSASVKIDQVRIHNQLFKSENPAAHPDGFLKDLNPNSEEVFTTAVIEPSFAAIRAKSPMNIPIENSEFNIIEKPGNQTVRFQALRVGYFCLDKDSSDEKIILNRIVTLKEDSAKN
ncbi:uncharacterized protein PRCAT00001753001 [Priceomyces carsonii]|uniref:uncharacterized protein n=1 Tax=Priceomyces carsonii TaxID=28549 RepID=UPI002EDA8416|nr:unnamed protein product [Priceomyces carsonii]